MLLMFVGMAMQLIVSKRGRELGKNYVFLFDWFAFVCGDCVCVLIIICMILFFMFSFIIIPLGLQILNSCS